MADADKLKTRAQILAAIERLESQNTAKDKEIAELKERLAKLETPNDDEENDDEADW